jgi:hypothetical protein
MVVDVVPLGLWLLLCVVVVRGVTQHGYYMLEYTGTDNGLEMCAK